MEILDVKDNIDEAKLKKIALGIKAGKLCLFPTETVYGIGTNGLDENAVAKIYAVKRRNKQNPINLLVSDKNMIESITQDISPLEYKLMENFFPGPFTIILKRKNIVPNIVTANSDLVGIRMSSSKIVNKLVQLANVPIAAPSANLTGKLSGTNLVDVLDDFSDSIDFAIDGGKSKIGMESTIVRVIDEIPHILRLGSILPSDLERVVGKVILEENRTELLPSSKMKHYQLDIDSILVYYEDTQKMIDKIDFLSQDYKNPIILCCQENLNFYSSNNVIVVASKYNLKEYSRNLFSCLKKASTLSPDIILVEGVKKEGIGLVIMNRLEHICNQIFL